jgi:hypothetical protein
MKMLNSANNRHLRERERKKAGHWGGVREQMGIITFILLKIP